MYFIIIIPKSIIDFGLSGFNVSVFFVFGAFSLSSLNFSSQHKLSFGVA